MRWVAPAQSTRPFSPFLAGTAPRARTHRAEEVVHALPDAPHPHPDRARALGGGGARGPRRALPAAAAAQVQPPCGRAGDPVPAAAAATATAAAAAAAWTTGGPRGGGVHGLLLRVLRLEALELAHRLSKGLGARAGGGVRG